MKNPTLGLNIRYLRKLKKMNQQEFGELFGKTKAAVSTWENETSLPPLSTLMKFSEMLGTDMDTMIFGNVEDGKKSNNIGKSNQNSITSESTQKYNKSPLYELGKKLRELEERINKLEENKR